MIVIGIDPGKTGAIAVAMHNKYTNVSNVDVFDMPETEKDMWEFFSDVMINASVEGERAVAYVEKVHPFSGQGIKSAWTFSGNYHCLRMALVSCRLPFLTVSPKKWQQELGIYYPKNSTQTQKKNIGKAKAQEIFPSVKFTKSQADSLLIMKYGIMNEK